MMKIDETLLLLNEELSDDDKCVVGYKLDETGSVIAVEFQCTKEGCKCVGRWWSDR
jgi:hypothetical protein